MPCYHHIGAPQQVDGGAPIGGAEGSTRRPRRPAVAARIAGGREAVVAAVRRATAHPPGAPCHEPTAMSEMIRAVSLAEGRLTLWLVRACSYATLRPRPGKLSKSGAAWDHPAVPAPSSVGSSTKMRMVRPSTRSR